MAGIACISAQQFVDLNGRPQAGAKAFFYEGGTTTPLSTYSEAGLGTLQTNPVVADAYGRFPMIFLDEGDEFYSFRVTTPGGTVVPIPSANSSIPIVGPSGEGGGSEVPVDPNGLLQTGDLKPRLGSGIHAGWARVNGRTIGSASSGATERANADTQALFEYLWGEFSNTLCPVSGGRGANAAADFAANKTLTLIDAKGRAFVGVDTMGSGVAASRLTAATIVTGAADTPGSSGGTETHTLTEAQLASHTHSANVTDPGHGHATNNNGQQGNFSAGGSTPAYSSSGTNPPAITSSSNTTGITVANIATGGGAAHNNMPPFFTGTWYVRL